MTEENNTQPEQNVSSAKKSTSGKVLKYLGAGLIALLFLLTLLVFFRDSIVKFSICGVGSKLTGTKVHLQEFSTSLSGRIQLKGFSVGNPAGYSKENAIELKEALADINIPSLFTDRKIVNLISVRGMHVNVESDFNGNNLSKILSNIQNFSSSASEKKKEAAPQKEQASENSDKEEKKSGLEIVRLDSENAQVTFKNTIVPQGIVLPLPPIHLNNIGGTNLQDTASQILSQLLSVVSSTANSADQAVRDIFSGTGKQINDAVQATGKELQQQSKEIGDKIKEAGAGLFNSFKSNFKSR